MKFGLKSIALASSVFLAACTPAHNRDSSLKHGGGGHEHPEEVQPVLDPSAITYWKDIKPLFETKCVSCHSENGLAPFELGEYAMVKGFRKSIKTAVSTRAMPPWSADPGHQSYKNDASLSSEEISTIVSWIDAGAKEGDESQYVRRAVAPAFASDIRIPVVTEEGGFLPKQDRNDDYHCFIVPIGQEFVEKPYITGFNTIPGNPRIVHHLVAYYVTPEILDLMKELDEEEPGNGFQCFGGALPDRLGVPAVQAAIEAKHPGALKLLNANNHWVSEWAPGQQGFNFPENSGFKVQAGGAFVMQMHYYTADAKGEVDTGTTLELKTAATVAKPGFVFPLTNQAWLLSAQNKSMVIPAGTTQTFEAAQNLAKIMAYGLSINNLPLTTPVKSITKHSAGLHMHSIGKSGVISFESAIDGSQQETLLSIGNWDLHWQRDYTFTDAKVFPAAAAKATNVKVSCTFQNDKATDVLGGFGSMDEMCFDFGFYSLELETAAPAVAPAL